MQECGSMYCMSLVLYNFFTANMLNIKEGSSQTKIPEEVDNLK